MRSFSSDFTGTKQKETINEKYQGYNGKKRKLTSKKRITVPEEEHVPVARGRIKEKTAGIHLRFWYTQLDLRRFHRRRYYNFRRSLNSKLRFLYMYSIYYSGTQKIMSLWRKKLVLHSSRAGVSNGQMQNPIIGTILPSSDENFGEWVKRKHTQDKFRNLVQGRGSHTFIRVRIILNSDDRRWFSCGSVGRSALRLSGSVSLQRCTSQLKLSEVRALRFIGLPRRAKWRKRPGDGFFL